MQIQYKVIYEGREYQKPDMGYQTNRRRKAGHRGGGGIRGMAGGAAYGKCPCGKGFGDVREDGKSIRENWWETPKKKRYGCDSCLFFYVYSSNSPFKALLINSGNGMVPVPSS